MDFLRNWTVEPTAVGLLVTSLFIYYLHVRICIYRTRLKCRFFELSFHPCRRRCHLQGTFSPFRSVVWRLWRGRETFWGAKKGRPLSPVSPTTEPTHPSSSLFSSLLQNIFLGFPFPLSMFCILCIIPLLLCYWHAATKEGSVRPDVIDVTWSKKGKKKLSTGRHGNGLRKKMECKLEVIDFHRQTQ